MNSTIFDKEFLLIAGIRIVLFTLELATFFNINFILFYLIGCGVNLNNLSPTTSINQLITSYNQSHSDNKIELISQEELLASTLVKFELFYKEFCENGRGFEPFFDIYYKRWLHR